MLMIMNECSYSYMLCCHYSMACWILHLLFESTECLQVTLSELHSLAQRWIAITGAKPNSKMLLTPFCVVGNRQGWSNTRRHEDSKHEAAVQYLRLGSVTRGCSMHNGTGVGGRVSME